MSYQLCIWDPSRHAPLPASADEALETLERLSAVSDTRNATLEKFGSALVTSYEAGLSEALTQEGIEAYWGSDPRAGTRDCRTAVYRLAIPLDECTPQVSGVVTAAATCGLVVIDDETGVCFLPDGTIYPEDMREMWEATFADQKAGPPDPGAPVPDSRTLLQKVAGELFDALGRGNKRLS